MESRHHFPTGKVIAISGGGKIGAIEYLNFAKVLGAQKTFSNPFDLSELLEAVRELLQIS